MMWRTHLFFGLNSLWLLQLLPGGIDARGFPLVIGCAAAGSLLPDLDASESKIKHISIGGLQPFVLPSIAVHRQFGHRGATHSLLGIAWAAALSLPFAYWLGWQPPAALVLGYLSHLAADACTKTGIPLLHPRRMRYFLLPSGWRFVTGSQAEETLFPLLALGILFLLLHHLPYAPLT